MIEEENTKEWWAWAKQHLINIDKTDQQRKTQKVGDKSLNE